LGDYVEGLLCQEIVANHHIKLSAFGQTGISHGYVAHTGIALMVDVWRYAVHKTDSFAFALDETSEGKESEVGQLNSGTRVSQ